MSWAGLINIRIPNIYNAMRSKCSVFFLHPVSIEGGCSYFWWCQHIERRTSPRILHNRGKTGWEVVTDIGSYTSFKKMLIRNAFREIN